MPMQYRYNTNQDSTRGLVNALASIDASNQFDEKLAQAKAESDALNLYRDKQLAQRAAEQASLEKHRAATLALQNRRYNDAKNEKALLTDAMLKAYSADLNPVLKETQVDAKPWEVNKDIQKSVLDSAVAASNPSLAELRDEAVLNLNKPEVTPFSTDKGLTDKIDNITTVQKERELLPMMTSIFGESDTPQFPNLTKIADALPSLGDLGERGIRGSDAPIGIGPRTAEKASSNTASLDILERIGDGKKAAPTETMIKEEMKRLDAGDKLIGAFNKVDRPDITLDMAKKLGLTKEVERQATAEEMQRQGVDLINTLYPNASAEEKLGFLQTYNSRIKTITDARDKIEAEKLKLEIFGAKEDKKLANKKQFELYKSSDEVKSKKPLTAKERIDLNKAIQALDDQWYVDAEEQRQIDEYKKILEQGHY